MPMDRDIVVMAPAKVNLVLRVLDRRPDGFHNLWSLFQTVGLEDAISLRFEPGAGALTVTCDDAALPTDGRNLVTRAAHLVLDRAGAAVASRGLAIHIGKRIPMGGGLGGGSSDAAATIVGLNHLLGLGWSAGEMAKLGERLGSDVPFFFYAPSARVRGRGEDVEPVTVTGSRWLVLVNPGFPIDTKGAYDKLAAARRQQGVRPLQPALARLVGRATLSWDEVIPLMENDFESALAPFHPELAEIKTGLILAGAEAALLSGSGATVFGVFRNEAAALKARDSLRLAEGWKAFAAPAGSGPLRCADPAPSGPASAGRLG
jgi:4-diphosphocytidyl-2-C-methyl-D-erythritol kinase